MYLYRLGCRVLEPCFPTIHPNMDGRRAPRFPKRVFCPERDFHDSRHALSWFPKRSKVPETRFSCSGRFSWFPRSAFMVPETRFHGSRNALSWFPKRPFMVPETTSMVPETAFMVPEMRSWFPKHGSRTDARPPKPKGTNSTGPKENSLSKLRRG